MDTIQLALILRKDKYTRGVFQGVYPSDKLTVTISSYPALFVANVDMSGKPGSHWVSFYFTKDRDGEYFDSYGQPPSSNTQAFNAFLDNNFNNWTFNTVTLQSVDSDICGYYCLYFTLFHRRDVNMNSIVNRFSKNKCRNDHLVKHFIEKNFPLSLRKYHHLVTKQRAKARYKVQ